MQKQLIYGWWKVISQKHKVSLANFGWAVSVILFILTIIGIVTLDSNSVYLLPARILFGLLCILYFWYFFVQIPAEMFEQERLKSRGLLDLQSTQRMALNQKNSPPQQYLNFIVNRITLYKPQKDKPYADVELYLSNGTVFSLDFEIQVSKTILNINNTGEHALTTKPTDVERRPDKLNAGCLNNQISFKQELPEQLLNDLWNMGKHTSARWKFEVKIRFNGEIGQTPEYIYNPQWEGEHFKIQEL